MRSLGRVALVAAIVAVVGLGALAVAGVRARSNPDRPSTAPPSTVVERPPAPELRNPDVVLSGEDGGLPGPAPTVGGLAAGDTVLVEASGLPANRSGRAYQCVEPDPVACLGAVPVRTDDSGVARVVVPVDDEVRGQPCRASACVVVLEVGGVRQQASLVFGQGAPRTPVLHVDTDGAVRDGDAISVTIRNAEPGRAVEVTECTSIVDDVEPCGGIAPVVRAVAGPDGSARLEYRIVLGDVGGPGGGRCGRGADCGIAVVDGDEVRSVTARLRIAGTPPVDHDGTRLAAGLAVAAVLAAGAIVLARRTDWSAYGLPSTTDDA